jgi:hypothetical protein
MTVDGVLSESLCFLESKKGHAKNKYVKRLVLEISEILRQIKTESR